MRLLILIVALALTGCGTVSPIAMLQMSRLDPLTADPSLIAARLDLPNGLKVPQGGAILLIDATRSDTNAALRGVYALVETDRVWRLSIEDATALKAVQQTIQAWKAEEDDAVSGSLSLTVNACIDGTAPDPDAAVAADLSLDGGTRFFPFLRGVTVRDVTQAINQGPQGQMRQCAIH